MIDTPLGEDELVLMALSGREEISRLFTFQLELLSERDGIKPEELVGKNVTVGLVDMDQEIVYLNGYISGFANLGSGDRGTVYHAEMVPWTWFLTRRTDCRIFQEKTIPEIVAAVFESAGFNDFDMTALRSNYKPQPYVVQYRESDFDFISRLLENEGIFYFFRHENGKHIMTFGDSTRAYQPAKQSNVSFTGSLAFQEIEDDLTAWEHRYEFRTGRVSSYDFNFETPQTPVSGKEKTVLRLPGADKFELFDYPGEHMDPGHARERNRVRMEEEEAAHERIRGQGRVRSFSPGFTFTIDHYQPQERGKTYVLTSVQHTAVAGAYVTSGTTPEEYSNAFECLPASVTFRPQRITPKALVRGLQTATVVGPAGEEIYTDKYGRVKVHFHWDRYGKKNENSSCWIRVSQMWAGKGYGAISIPRVGEEVIVDFLEGDPAKPIIVGRVYNSDATTPTNLPAQKIYTSLKSLSTPGGGGFNELRFCDSKDSEHVFLHSCKDFHQRTGNDSFEYVTNDQHTIVNANQLAKINGDRHLKIQGDDNSKIGGTVSQNVGMDFQQKVGMNHALQAGMEIHMKAGMNVVIEAGMSLTIKAGGGFINIGPAGVAISGPMVMINSGGAAGNGAGCSPDEPQDAVEAMKSEPGDRLQPQPGEPPTPEQFGPSATVMKRAAERGTPFCEKCAEAAGQNAATGSAGAGSGSGGGAGVPAHPQAAAPGMGGSGAGSGNDGR